jgi:hypothetical protein
MNNEQPIAFPRDLEEDWRVAELTEAPIEAAIVVRDEWRKSVEPHAELYIPARLASRRLKADLYEPEPDDMQRLLYRVAELRPAKIQPGERLGEIGADETHAQLTALDFTARLDLNEHAGQWARYVTYMLADVPFERAAKIHQNFEQTVSDKSKWTSLALQAYAAYASGETTRRQLERIVMLMQNEPRFEILTRKMIGLNLAQITYWRDLQSTYKVQHVLRRLESDRDRKIVEPLLQLDYVAGTLPMDDIVDSTTGEVIPSGLPELELSTNGQVMRRAMERWKLLEKQPPTTDEYADTRSELVRCGLPGNQFAKLAYWARRFTFDVAQIDWAYAAAAHEQYGITYQMNGNAWSEHTQQLRGIYLEKDGELERLLETCIQLVGVPPTGHDLCRRVVALSMDEAMHWKKLMGFAGEVEAALADQASIDTLRKQLGTWAIREPSMIRRGDLRFTEEDLTYLAIDTLVADESGPIDSKDV